MPNKLPKKQDSFNESFIHLDFEKVFPYIFWTSAWVKNEQFPKGLRYKILSVRHALKNEVEIILIQEARNIGKLDLLRASISVDKFDSSDKNTMVRMAEQKFEIKFDRVDMSAVPTFEEFEKKSKEVGWEMW